MSPLLSINGTPWNLLELRHEPQTMGGARRRFSGQVGTAAPTAGSFLGEERPRAFEATAGYLTEANADTLRTLVRSPGLKTVTGDVIGATPRQAETYGAVRRTGLVEDNVTVTFTLLIAEPE